MQEIVKDFAGIKALDGVSCDIFPAEIHALVGENGAGKSTLMKILSGVYPTGTFQGKILIDGKPVVFNNPKSSEDAGIAIIYQELILAKNLSVLENICLGREAASYGVINWAENIRTARRVLAQVGLDVDLNTKVGDLGVGQQQMVVIARALFKKARILILDEPTAALSSKEADMLLNILKELKAQGVTCIYISHRLKEIFEIADRITVLRDGKTVAVKNKADLNEEGLIALMVGRSLANLYPKENRTPQEVIWDVRDWTLYDQTTNKHIDHVNFQLRRGEVLGLAGLVGCGRTELVMSFFGLWGKWIKGSMDLNGKSVEVTNAAATIKAGISLASEDRKRYGLVLEQHIQSNVSLASLASIAKYSVVDEASEIVAAGQYTKELRIKSSSILQKTIQLSGGNQQKVVLAKWLMTKPKVLILDEPTRGIDVGAKIEIYQIINQLVAQGVGVLVISSEMNELLGVCDRIMVMNQGKITGDLLIKDATQEKIMAYAVGHS